MVSIWSSFSDHLLWGIPTAISQGHSSTLKGRPTSWAAEASQLQQEWTWKWILPQVSPYRLQPRLETRLHAHAQTLSCVWLFENPLLVWDTDCSFAVPILVLLPASKYLWSTAIRKTQGTQRWISSGPPGSSKEKEAFVYSLVLRFHPRSMRKIHTKFPGLALASYNAAVHMSDIIRIP